jgi:hypothetical protein
MVSSWLGSEFLNQTSLRLVPVAKTLFVKTKASPNDKIKIKIKDNGVVTSNFESAADASGYIGIQHQGDCAHNQNGEIMRTSLLENHSMVRGIDDTIGIVCHPRCISPCRGSPVQAGWPLSCRHRSFGWLVWRSETTR